MSAHKLTMHKDIVTALGALVLTTSAVETGLGTFLAWLVGHPNPDKILPLVGGMEATVKLGLIVRLGSQQFPDKHKLISDLCEDIQNAFQKRNDIVHGLIAPTDDPRVLQVQATKFTRKGKLPKAKPYTPEEIFAISKEIHGSYMRLEKLFNGLPAQQF